MKQMNRQLELQYRRAEILTSWLSQTGEWQGNEALKEGWKIILRNSIPRYYSGLFDYRGIRRCKKGI